MLRPLVNITFIVILACMAVLLPQAQASDTESEPFMIYIDPETGKYTTTKPGAPASHGPTAAGRQAPETTPWLPAAIGSVGLLLCCYLLALLQTRLLKPRTHDRQHR